LACAPSRTTELGHSVRRTAGKCVSERMAEVSLPSSANVEPKSLARKCAVTWRSWLLQCFALQRAEESHVEQGPRVTYAATVQVAFSAQPISCVLHVRRSGRFATEGLSCSSARSAQTVVIVPAMPPPLGFTSSSHSLILSWAGAYELITATNVAGPYLPATGASSPMTNQFLDPQRFFQLRILPP
jgi:hypothetical protein